MPTARSVALSHRLFLGGYLFTLVACAHSGEKRGLASDALPNASQISTWVEMNPNGGGLARVITTDSICPTATVSGHTIAMRVRDAGTPDGRFPHLVCEMDVPTGAEAWIGSEKLPVIPAHPQRIVVIGDTGCRIKISPPTTGGHSNGHPAPDLIQNCKSEWPFATIAEQAAGQMPDLVIHVGDYHYRESACPPGNDGCANSVYGDVWESWSEDFFQPAHALLRAAPWIFVRGNHEICQRAHVGYFRFLDPHPLQNGLCDDTVPPYAVSFEGLDLVVHDSSFKDFTPSLMQTVANLPVKKAWLLTHRPPWISAATLAAGDSDEPQPARTVAATTAAVGVAANIGLVLVGHQHIFRATTFADQRPPQVIAGNGGTLLELNPSFETVGTPVDASSTTLASTNTFDKFGFLLLKKEGAEAWQAQIFDAQAKSNMTCDLNSKDKNGFNLTCNAH